MRPVSVHLTIRLNGAILERLEALSDHIGRVHFPAKPTTNRSDLVRAAIAVGVVAIEAETAADVGPDPS
jgi:predicted DNA-binding protein